MNVFVLSVEQPEVDEEPREESEVRLVPVTLVSCPDLITETLGLPTTIIESNMFVLWSKQYIYREECPGVLQRGLLANEPEDDEEVEEEGDGRHDPLEGVRRPDEGEVDHDGQGASVRVVL